MMTFLTGEADADSNVASFWKWRIRHAVGKAKAASQATTSTSTLGSYQPRSSAGGLLSIGKSIRKGRYSESILSHMQEVAVSLALSRKQTSSGSFLQKVYHPVVKIRKWITSAGQGSGQIWQAGSDYKKCPLHPWIQRAFPELSKNQAVSEVLIFQRPDISCSNSS